MTGMWCRAANGSPECPGRQGPKNRHLPELFAPTRRHRQDTNSNPHHRPPSPLPGPPSQCLSLHHAPCCGSRRLPCVARASAMPRAHPKPPAPRRKRQEKSRLRRHQRHRRASPRSRARPARRHPRSGRRQATQPMRQTHGWEEPWDVYKVSGRDVGSGEGASARKRPRTGAGSSMACLGSSVELRGIAAVAPFVRTDSPAPRQYPHCTAH